MGEEERAAEAAAKVERERIAAEAAAKAEEERLAAEASMKAEEEKQAAEAAAKAEEERLAAEAALKAHEERLAAEAAAAAKAEEEQRAAEAEAKAKEERLVAEAALKAEEKRLAAETAAKAEEEKRAAEAAATREGERIAAEAAAKAEKERLAAEAAAKAEEEKQAAEAAAEAEEERLRAEAIAKAEQERLAARAKAEKEERAAAAVASEARRAAEAAVKAEEERLARESAAKLAKEAEEEKLAVEAARQAQVQKRAAEETARIEEQRLAAEAAAKADAVSNAVRLAAETAAKAEKDRTAAEAARQQRTKFWQSMDEVKATDDGLTNEDETSVVETGKVAAPEAVNAAAISRSYPSQAAMEADSPTRRLLSDAAAALERVSADSSQAQALVDMGFKEDDALTVVKETTSVDEAANILLEREHPTPSFWQNVADWFAGGASSDIGEVLFAGADADSPFKPFKPGRYKIIRERVAIGSNAFLSDDSREGNLAELHCYVKEDEIVDVAEIHVLEDGDHNGTVRGRIGEKRWITLASAGNEIIFAKPVSLISQLMDLGYSFNQAQEAAKRCSSVEAAVEYLTNASGH